VKILFADIVYIESQREYIRIVTTKKEYLSKISTHEMEALLPAHLFKTYPPVIYNFHQQDRFLYCRNGGGEWSIYSYW